MIVNIPNHPILSILGSLAIFGGLVGSIVLCVAVARMRP